MTHKIGIVGLGFVGSACEINFSAIPDTQTYCYDKFKASESLDTVVINSEIIFICVPTPMREDGSCDTSIVFDAVRRINKRAKVPKVIVIKSTVPPGTTHRLQTEFDRHTFFFNPEFLTEARFIEDFAEQKLIVIGESLLGPDSRLTNLYLDFTSRQKAPATIFNCDAATAEMMKYTINCYLATKVIFFNEIHEICKQTGVSYGVLTDLLKYDNRIGKTHMQVPGPDGDYGFAKSCFPKDLNALIALAKVNNVDTTLLSSVWAKNLMVRKNHDWKKLKQVTGNYKSGVMRTTHNSAEKSIGQPDP